MLEDPTACTFSVFLFELGLNYLVGPFIAALFIIVKSWGENPSMDKCINKLWYVHTGEYYRVIKKE